jgi:hypothetical protein
MKGQKPAKPGSKMNKPGPKINIAHALPDSNARLSSNVQDVIGKQLRAMYDDLVNQAVPDRFTELLQKLDNRDGQATR